LAASFTRLKTTLDAQLAKLSANERRLLMILSLLIPVGALYFAYSFQQSAQQDHNDAQARFAEAQLAARRTTGSSLASDIEKSRAQVREWSWEGSTVAVAQVRAQSQIAELAANSGLANAEVKTSDHFEPAGEVTLAPIDITAPFSWPALSEFMSALTATGKGFVLEQVQLTTDRDPKVRISLKAPLTVSPPVVVKAKAVPKVTNAAKGKAL
jgi:hypothetical protein